MKKESKGSKSTLLYLCFITYLKFGKVISNYYTVTTFVLNSLEFYFPLSLYPGKAVAAFMSEHILSSCGQLRQNRDRVKTGI